MKRFLITIIILILPFIIIIPCVNYIVDPANVWGNGNMEDKIIEGLSQKKNVTGCRSNLNERYLQRKFAELNAGKQFEYLILGPSRVMLISEKTLTSDSIINLGMSAAQLPDMIAMYEICKENNISFKRVIIGIDPTMFNPEMLDFDLWKENSEYYYRFKGISGEKVSNDKISNLCSISYFQQCIQYFMKHGNWRKNIICTDLWDNTDATRHYDGSISYPKEFRNRSQETVDSDAKKWNHNTFKKFEYVSSAQKEDFTLLIDQFQKNDVKIYFFCCPYHPYTYERICKNPAVVSAMQYVYDYAKQNNISIISSYNPVDAKVNNASFYDAAHLKQESIDRIFLFLN